MFSRLHNTVLSSVCYKASITITVGFCDGKFALQTQTSLKLSQIWLIMVLWFGQFDKCHRRLCTVLPYFHIVHFLLYTAGYEVQIRNVSHSLHFLEICIDMLFADLKCHIIVNMTSKSFLFFLCMIHWLFHFMPKKPFNLNNLSSLFNKSKTTSSRPLIEATFNHPIKRCTKSDFILF